MKNLIILLLFFFPFSSYSQNSINGDSINIIEVSIVEEEIYHPEEEVFIVVEFPPSFPGGENALVNFIKANLRYPQSAKESGIEGRVIITFVVSETGKIGSPVIIRGIDKECDEEAIRLIKSMPDWIPGKMNGRKVKVKYTLPVRFKISE